ncbi:MAG: carboxymuconolactone decarboxylase family protein [Magnetospirillum sp.]|nr:carboxymuconolactone decarboxylase family protein [Magnetospirillum sp.]
MTRDVVYRDIEGKLGIVPAVFKAMPDDELELEWKLFQRVQLDDQTLPAKYRELIGLAAASAVGDPYCMVAHRELAKLFGAADEELERAVAIAKSVAGFGAYLTGCDISLETMRQEIGQICDFVRTARGSVEAGAQTGVALH